MPNLRERKKDETRRALMHAALDLFTTHGFERVTVEQIAERANVSTRTFFRYFETKAAACFGHRTPIVDRLRASDDILTTAVQEIYDFAERVRATPVLYETHTRLALDHPQVRAKWLEMLLEFDDVVTEGLLRESPGLDPALARLAAYIPNHLVRATMETWVLEGAPPAGPDWEPRVTAAMRVVEQLVGR